MISQNNTADFQKFIRALAKFKNADNNSTFQSFIAEIQDLKCNDFRWYYSMAMHQYKENNLNTASKFILKSIELLKNVSNNLLARFGQENCVELFEDIEHYGIPIGLGSKYEQSAQVYLLAGEIFACLGELDDSEKFYNLYHYNKTFLNSEFNDKDTVELYSYRAITEYSLDDLNNKTITVCHPSTMNDPFDSLIIPWRSNEVMEKMCNEKRHISSYQKSLDYFRIRCFSTNCPQNMLMWSHYANEHKGFCIKYRLSKHFIKGEESIFNKHMYLKKIKYTSDKTSIETKTINSSLGYATKHKDWEYENEIRLISFDPEVKGKYSSIRIDDASSIEEIYFGCRCSDSDIKKIKNICAKKYPEMKFYKMMPNTSDIYNLTQQEIQ